MMGDRVPITTQAGSDVAGLGEAEVDADVIGFEEGQIKVNAG